MKWPRSCCSSWFPSHSYSSYGTEGYLHVESSLERIQCAIRPRSFRPSFITNSTSQEHSNRWKCKALGERSYDQYDSPEASPNRYGRTTIATIVIIVATIGIYLSVLFPIIDSELYLFLLISFLIPMFCLLFCTTCAWARGSLTSRTDPREDALIFEEMHLRASRAHPMNGTDWYRCPECKEAFELSNAKPIDDKVFQCPFCDSRLLIG